MEIGLRKFRQEISFIFDAVHRGESVVITRRGKPFAEIKSIEIKKIKDEEKFQPIGFGLWADREEMKDVESWVQESRKSRFR